jgi:hypothetical protein
VVAAITYVSVRIVIIIVVIIVVLNSTVDLLRVMCFECVEWSFLKGGLLVYSGKNNNLIIGLFLPHLIF